MDAPLCARDSTIHSTKSEIVVGGLKVYVYGLAEVKQQVCSELVILYFCQGRTGSYLDIEDVVHEIVHQYRASRPKLRAGRVAVTFNMRNHGDRIVCLIPCALPPGGGGLMRMQISNDANILPGVTAITHTCMKKSCSIILLT